MTGQIAKPDNARPGRRRHFFRSCICQILGFCVIFRSSPKCISVRAPSYATLFVLTELIIDVRCTVTPGMGGAVNNGPCRGGSLSAQRQPLNQWRHITSRDQSARLYCLMTAANRQPSGAEWIVDRFGPCGLIDGDPSTAPIIYSVSFSVFSVADVGAPRIV